MKTRRQILPVLLTASVALTASSVSVNADVNPFVSQEIIPSYHLVTDFEAEGRCGEGKCGENAADKLKRGEQVPSGPDKSFKAEGRCGEAKCGANASDKAE